MPTLHWLTRDEDVRAAAKTPTRLLEELPELGYGDRDAGNMLIQGDNLEALKALLPYYAGQVKCIYIDPPYNTRSAFEHYDDNLEHSKWLAMIWPRLELLRELLAKDGSIWVSIDDNEAHYLKIVMDELFGRSSFVANVVWQKKSSPQANSIWLSDSHDHILIFAKNKEIWRPHLLPRTEVSDSRYLNPDNDPRGDWTSSDFTISLTGGQRGAQYAKTGESNNVYEIVTPSGRRLWPSKGRCWGTTETRFKELCADNRIWFGQKGNNVPRQKRFLSEVQEGIVCMTVWSRNEVGDNQDAKREIVKFNSDEIFATPKPETLLLRILTLATNSGDLVLDSFLGSGSTAAVAQKMGRRYIGIELGDHAVTHCVPRLRKVIDGEQGGISKAQNWHGGGGFRFYRLGPPVFMGNGAILPDIRFPVLAAHLWFAETGIPWTQPARLTPFLGGHDGRGYALLYNGILRERSTNGGNVLTRTSLATIRRAQGEFMGPLTVYGERTTLRQAALTAEAVVFKQTPYEVKVNP